MNSPAKFLLFVAILGLVSGARAEQLAGVVTDAGGGLVAGARVLSPHAEPSMPVTTNADGKFVLENLPTGFVAVVALHVDKGVVSTRQISGGSDVSLKLVPFSPPFRKDPARAEKILSELSQWANGIEHVLYDALWADLAMHDLERAIELGRKPDGSLPESFITSVIAILAREDPAKAAQWGIPLLDQIQTAWRHSFTAAMLAARLVEIDPLLANELFERAIAVRDEDDTRLADARFMGLALHLRRPEGPELVRRRLEAARISDVENEEEEEEWKSDRSSEAEVIGEIARYDMAQAERLVEGLAEPQRADAQARLIQVLVDNGGEKNMLQARQLLETLAANRSDKGQKFFSMATLSMIHGFGRTDPVSALTLARRVTSDEKRAEALAAAARWQPEVERQVLWREAAVAALRHPAPMSELVNIALLASPSIPTLASELTAQVRRMWQDAPAQARDGHWESGAASRWVTLLAETDKLAARETLELEWVRIYPNAANTERVWVLSAIGSAMAEVDFDRALEMARSIPEGELGFVLTRYSAERGMALRLLVGPEKWNLAPGYRWNRRTLAN